MKKLLFITSAICVGAISSLSHAADMTSVASLTGQISARLSQLQNADFIQQNTQEIKAQPRSLRHIYVQARTNFSHINLLRAINGLEAKPAPALKLKKWDEADIETVLKAQMENLDELNVVYNIKSAPESLPQIGSDIDSVFLAFLSVEKQLLSLGIPGQGPGTSYQYATMLLNMVKQLAKHQKVTLPSPNPEKVTDKRPNDNYLYALSVAAELQYYLTEYLKVDIPGGVVVPEAKDGKGSSDDTIAVIKTILADIVALKLTIGDNSPLEIPPHDISRSPSDVYKQLVFAYDIIFALEDAAAEAS